MPNVEMRELLKDSKLNLVCPPDFANVPLKIKLGDTGVPQKFGPRHNTALMPTKVVWVSISLDLDAHQDVCIWHYSNVSGQLVRFITMFNVAVEVNNLIHYTKYLQ